MKKLLIIALSAGIIAQGVSFIPESTAPVMTASIPHLTKPNKVTSVPSIQENKVPIDSPLMAQIRDLTRSLEFDQAIALLERLPNEETTLLRAALLIAKGDRKEIEDYLHHIVEKHPSGEMKLKALSLLNITQTYDLHRDADESYLWTLFSQKLGEFQEWDIAQYLAARATERKSEYRDAWIMRGYSELKLKKLHEAEESLLQAYQLDPGNANVQYLLGTIYFQLDKPELSTQYLLYAKDQHPLHEEDILKKLAENAVKTEDFALASHYYESILKINASDAQTLSRLVWLQGEKLGRDDEAMKYAKLRLEYYPDDSESAELMNWLLSKQS